VTNLELWSAVVGLFLPLAVAVLQPVDGSSARRALISLAAGAFVSMAAVAVYGHGWSVRLQASSLTPLLVTMWASYAGFWRELGIPQAIELFRLGLMTPEIRDVQAEQQEAAGEQAPPGRGLARRGR
jgi:hypothetical protein